MYCAEKHIPYVMCRLCIVCSLIVCGMPWRNCTDSLYAVVATFHFYLFRQCCTSIFFLIALELECWAHTYVLPPLWFANNNWMTIHPLFTFSICHSLKIPPTIIIKIGDTVHVNKSTCITLMLLYTFGVCSLTHLLACLISYREFRNIAIQHFNLFAGCLINCGHYTNWVYLQQHSQRQRTSIKMNVNST